MGHPEVKWSMVSSCSLHNRHLLSISSFKILFLTYFVLIAWSWAATIVLSVSPLMSPDFSQRSTSFSSKFIIIIIIENGCWKANLRLLSVILRNKTCSIYAAPVSFYSHCWGYNIVTWTVLRCKALQLAVCSASWLPQYSAVAPLRQCCQWHLGFQSADSLRSKLSNIILLLFGWLGDNVSMRNATALATTILKVGFVD